MDIRTDYISVSKTARYASLGKLGPSTKYFWFVLHGSNMLCEQMLYKFSEFDLNEHFIIAPEGLSRFYANGFSGDVVAAWMTRRDRLNEIEDFSNYLSQLFNKYSIQLPEACKRSVVGFSQGGTTAYRWLHHKQHQIDHFIPYSCWIPEDINLKKSATVLNDLRTTYTYGKQDQYLTNERIEALKAIIAQNNLEITIEPYDGDHRISRQQLRSIFEKYIAISRS